MQKSTVYKKIGLSRHVSCTKLQNFILELEGDYNKICSMKYRGDRGSTVVKVLCYKSEVRWFKAAVSSGTVRSIFGNVLYVRSVVLCSCICLFIYFAE